MTSGRSLTLAQLRSHVADIQKNAREARLIIGLHIANGAASDARKGPGFDRLECDSKTYAVVWADTVLALREALLLPRGPLLRPGRPSQDGVEAHALA